MLNTEENKHNVSEVRIHLWHADNCYYKKTQK